MQSGHTILCHVACFMATVGLMAAQNEARGVFVSEPIRVQKKLALIIGNQAYPQSPLKNSGNDAAAVARALRSMGFDDVTERPDLSFRKMREEINRFSARIQRGDLALFYYAGHGVQANEQNYLIPVDFAGTSEADLEYEAYPASQVRDKLEQSGARLRILVLDACRNNPFRAKRDGLRGLAPMASSVEGTYIAFATADNSAADDNAAEKNGLFTKHLLVALQDRSLDLKQVFEKTKQDVYIASERKQRPFTYDGVIGQFYFFGPLAKQPSMTAPADSAREAWEMAKGTKNRSMLEAVVREFPDSPYARLARVELAGLSASRAPASSSPIPTQPGATKVNPKDGLKYIWIPPGQFLMGCSPGDSECRDDEKPTHEVTITRGFWIGRTEVTQDSYQRVTGTNPSPDKGPMLPVTVVTWNDAQTYCQFVGMRLPTEAEWEYAARGGNTSPRHGPLDSVAWHGGNSGRRKSEAGREVAQTHEVGQKDANAFGLYDIMGNVWEWVADWYADYSAYAATDPQGPPSGDTRVVRGGSSISRPSDERASARFSIPPKNHHDNVGFRCAGE